MFSLSVFMQGEQEYSEWIFLGWQRHGLVAGESPQSLVSILTRFVSHTAKFILYCSWIYVLHCKNLPMDLR